jgi:hypothetical protein
MYRGLRCAAGLHCKAESIGSGDSAVLSDAALIQELAGVLQEDAAGRLDLWEGVKGRVTKPLGLMPHYLVGE